MQATGSDQDKPLGSRALSSLQGGLSGHTLLYLSTNTHLSIFPRLSVDFFFSLPPVSVFLPLFFPVPRLVPHELQPVQKIQVWSGEGSGGGGFSGSREPQVFVETWSTLCPPPSYTSVSHLHHGSKFST